MDNVPMRGAVDAGAASPRRRRRRVVGPLLLLVAAWGLVAATHLTLMWLANPWLFVLRASGLAWIVAIAVTVDALVRLSTRSRTGQGATDARRVASAARKVWIVAAVASALLTGAIVLVLKTVSCPPLVECLSQDGTLFVRNALSEPVTVRFDRPNPKGRVDLGVDGEATRAFGFACEATRITVHRTTDGRELGSIPGRICVNKTWIIDTDGTATLEDGLPPED